MTKVFYSVNYMLSGSDKTHRMWFGNLEEAIKFSKADYYRGIPVPCILNDEKLIEMVEDLINLQKN